MQAFRLYNGSIIDVQVDLDPSGNPILPPNTTVDPRPEPLVGHYLTIIGNQWAQVEVVQPTFEHNKAEKAAAFEAFRDQYMDRPVQYSSVLFDADKQARERLTQALVMHREVGYLAPAWLTYANTPSRKLMVNLAGFDESTGLSAQRVYLARSVYVLTSFMLVGFSVTLNSRVER